MNRLKKIFAALRELAAEPSPGKAIAEAWASVSKRAGAWSTETQAEDRRADALIGKVIAAVVAIAEDSDKTPATPATAGEKASNS